MTEPVQPAPEPFRPVPPEPYVPLEAPTAPYVPTPAAAPATGAPVKRSRGGQALWVNVALGLALAVALGGVAFAAGRMTAPTSATALNGTGSGRFFGNGGYFPGGGGANLGGQGGRGFGGGGLSVEGTVTAMTAGSITITTATGQTVTIATTGSTTYHQQSSAAASDVKTGGKVIVQLGARTPQASPTTTGPTANDITVVP
jgi:hypothetical protein